MGDEVLEAFGSDWLDELKCKACISVMGKIQKELNRETSKVIYYFFIELVWAIFEL